MGQLPNPFNKELFLGAAKVSRIPEFWKSKIREIGKTESRNTAIKERSDE